MAVSFLSRLVRPLVLLLFLFVAGGAQAQIDNIYVYGTVKDYNTSKKLDGITVTVFKDGAKLNSVVTSANGKYEFNLDYGYDYKILFEKQGVVGKNVSINTKGIPEDDRQGGLAMNVEMTLFKDIPGIDYTILNQPIGKSKYDASTGMLAWDLEYTEQMRAELGRLQKAYDEKQKREADSEAAFAKLMEQGNAAMAAKEFGKAVQNFTDALGLRAGDPIATARLSDAKIKLGELERAEQRNKQYADLVKEADALLAKKSYGEAKAKYAAASGVKEEEAYPKQKIKECDAFLADLAAKADADRKAAEVEANFQAAIKAGDAAYKGAKYEEARTKYNEALGIKPKEKYPADQLAAIDKKLAELAAKAEADKQAAALDASFQAAIKAGDAAFQGAKYEEARTKYTEALGLKPKEQYPTAQLAAIDKKLAEQAAKAEADKKANELEAAYQAAVAAADAAMKQQDFGTAKTKYNDALVIKPKEKYPVDQLAAIAKAMADQAKKAEEERLAKERDATYQAAMDKARDLFTKADYEAAKAAYQTASGIKPEEALPKERIVEIDAKLAELAREAAAKRKQEELEAKFGALITSADKKFKENQHSEALNDYKNASLLKPDEQYPKDQIAAINAMLDNAAKEQAEKDRLAREQAEKNKQYAALVAQADKDFKAKSLDAATNGYTAALEVKPGEKHPTDRLAEIRALLNAQADADSLKAAQDAAERERLAEAARKKAEADSLKAAQEAAERDRSAAERLARERSMADLQARYEDAILRADAAFRNQAYDMAREGYNEALGVKPEENYPVAQLAAIEKALADRLKAEQDAAAAAEAQRLAAQERSRRQSEQADAERAALERAKQEREAQQALDARYNGVVMQADQAMAAKEYTAARDLYGQAVDIRPDETYPQVKIGQIDQLLAELERQRKEREQAAKQVEEAPRPMASANTDNRKEKEAEEFMREAREREEAEKYQRIKRQMADREQLATDQAGKADERHKQSTEQNEEYKASGAALYQGSEALRKRNAEELEAFRMAMDERRQGWSQRGMGDSQAARQQVENREADFRQQDVSLREQQADHAREVEERKQQWLAGLGAMADAGNARTGKAREELGQLTQRSGEKQHGLNALADQGGQQVEQVKQRQLARERQAMSGAMERTQGQYDRIGSIPPNEKRAFEDYARSELASQYPQGVTEESYTQGNKVIIKRVVVQGNKADEYSKVIAKWGTYYFKNGQSISEFIWTLHTGQ
ncbi:MAG: hypothetical protein KBF80_02860 [Flavobacteriales bacterium]|nr:hypothetical protein [Flavobacteriales bacterium]